ncbi:MAG: hypothetical protein M0030_25285 [Actinomycetota bacterium]|nr:hypothetical protein [Actinomycetota bacterium]
MSQPTAADQIPFGVLAERADAARAKVAAADRAAVDLLTEAVDAITAFNRAGLVSLVQALRADPRGADLLYAALDRPEVMALLVAHDIVRADRTLDVLRAAEQLRPYLVASGTDLEVLRVDGDVATVRFAGNPPDGMRADVRDTLLARVPGLASVVESEAEPEPAGRAFVPLDSIRVGRL